LAVDPRDIGKINEAKEDAKEAYLAGNYEAAVSKYRYLVDSIGVAEEEVMMNLASSYFHLNDTSNAISGYQPLTLSLNNKIKSVANQQIGVLNNREGKFEEALNYLKQAIKADPLNDDARFNYEMIKKKLAEQKKKEQEQKDQNKQDQEKKDEKQQDQKDKQNQDQKDQQKSEQDKKDQEKKEQEKKEQSKEQEKKDEESKKQKEQEIPPSVKEKLKDMDMSEEKAKMILEAMKNQEIQYLQQNKRKATKPKDRNKPDW
jgi:hypothetical protein